MRAWIHILWATVFLAVVSVPAIRAQQQNQDQQQSQQKPTEPIPAYHSPLAGVAGSGDAQDENAPVQALTPDTRPLAGVQDLSLGVPAIEHSFWQPHFSVTLMADTNPLGAKQTTGWTTYSTLMGGITVHRVSGRSDLLFTYSGGDTTISNLGSIGNSLVQSFELGETLSLRRSTVSFFDQLSYLPETSFGYAGVSGGPLLPGGGFLGPGFLPGESILTTRGQRISNSSMVQVDTLLTPRSSLTFVGGYSLLHFFSSNLLDFGDTVFQGGYNYQMTREDTLALFYRFSAFRYNNFNQSISDNSFQASYGHRVTGKLAFQIGGGPDVAFLALPLSPSSGSPSGTGGGSGNPPGTATSSATHIYWSLHTALAYQLQRGGLDLTYLHGLSGGSGVLAGSLADRVFGTATRQLSRTFNVSFDLGFARNKGLSVATTKPTSQSYDYWVTGVTLSHPWGPSLNLNLGYQLQYQNSNSSFCVGPACGKSVVRNSMSFGLAWNKRPIPF